MSLRTRLIVAFLLLSVVPLTAVTAQHYLSSLDTLHRVARRDAEQMTLELGQRMEAVKADLSERVERLWVDSRPDVPRRASRTVPQPVPNDTKAFEAEMAAGIAEALGETAALLDRLEFVPATPLPPMEPGAPRPAAAPAAPGAPAAPTAPAAPAAPASPGPVTLVGPAPPVSSSAAIEHARAVRGAQPAAPFVIDMKALREELKASGVEMEKWSPEVERLVARGLGLGANAASSGIKAGAVALQQLAIEARREARAKEEKTRTKTATRAKSTSAGAGSDAGADDTADDEDEPDLDLDPAPAPGRNARPATATHAEVAHAAFTSDGEGLDLMMQRDGKPVGKINATLRLNRVLGTVVSNTRRENGEIAFAFDPKGELVAENPDDKAAIEGLGITKDGQDFYQRDGWLVVMRDDPAGSGARFGIARRIGDSVRDLRVSAGRDLATGLGVIGLALVGIFPISGRLTKNLRKLHAGVDDLARGNYAARVDVTSSDEVGRLATAFNQMAGDIEQHQKQALERERLQRELELCRQIQNDMLPREPFRAAFADVKGISIPAREVGGDFFNYFTLADGDLAVLVGDVSGKGVSAALTMANVQATLKARLPVMADLAALVDSIDGEFEATSPRGVYATLFAAVLDRSTRTLRYVNAGHHPQFVLRANGAIDRLPSTGLPIGLLPGKGYVEQEIALNEGDLLFFYTDGAVETESETGEMFGAERLEALLVEAHNDGVDAVLERAESAVRAFRGGAEPFDDATMMALRVGR